MFGSLSIAASAPFLIIASGRATPARFVALTVLSLVPLALTPTLFWYVGCLGYAFGSTDAPLASGSAARVRVSSADLGKDQRVGYKYNGSVIEAYVVFVGDKLPDNSDGNHYDGIDYLADEDDVRVVADDGSANDKDRLVKVKVTSEIDFSAFLFRRKFAESSVLEVPRRYLRTVPSGCPLWLLEPFS
jgi:hypothetical protein